ncbi:MAG: bifunctional folylpolyglutamate synthase/dihydrofolate synthase, partial [Muribaculaceae bacterium]|nr:bifunctional folylpolyglutamate synthase/dihydrofolate synthase [Muribaculaceae bacterium]
GSTAHTIAAILQSQGYKTGLYTSPHLVDFRERIRVNGQKIEKQAVVDFIKRYQVMKDLPYVSFFELTTIMAFDYFASQNVDFAVIEVGLGGRLDSTNIISPILSVITNISKDHVAQLGDSIAGIAAEKAGIIKSGIPVVIGESNDITRSVFLSVAAKNESPIFFAPPLYGYHVDNNGDMIYPETSVGEITSALSGDCQPKNAATILTAINCLRTSGIKISNEAIKSGFLEVCELTGLMGRWMKLSSNPNVICDTGHNVGGWEYLSKRLASFGDKLKMIIGFVNDKDIRSIMQMMPTDAEYYFTRASIPRALDEHEVKRIAAEYGLKGECYGSVKDAFTAAKASASKDDTIFVGGSTFVVADILSFNS